VATDQSEGRSIGQGLIALTKKWKVVKLDALQNKLDTYLNREVAKFLAAGKESQADTLTDKVETLFVLIARARDQGLDNVAELRAMIESFFSDDVGKDASLVTLCSVHRSKGLEWDRVFLLGREELMPSQFARQPWQVAQEINLIYVAITRAKKTLFEVFGVKEEEKQHDQ
jgi:superfamily I DNA/RNA helicase